MGERIDAALNWVHEKANEIRAESEASMPKAVQIAAECVTETAIANHHYKKSGGDAFNPFIIEPTAKDVINCVPQAVIPVVALRVTSIVAQKVSDWTKKE